jgi:hypothetical protein
MATTRAVWDNSGMETKWPGHVWIFIVLGGLTLLSSVGGNVLAYQQWKYPVPANNTIANKGAPTVGDRPVTNTPSLTPFIVSSVASVLSFGLLAFVAWIVSHPRKSIEANPRTPWPDTPIANSARTVFDALPPTQLVALRIIYEHPGSNSGSIGLMLQEALGINDVNHLENIRRNVCDTMLVRREFGDTVIPNPAVESTVSVLLARFSLPPLSWIKALVGEVQESYLGKIERLERAAKQRETLEAGRSRVRESVWLLKVKAGRLKRYWPETRFINRPLDRALWSQEWPEDIYPRDWFEESERWYQKFALLPIIQGNDLSFLKSLDFEEVMRLLDKYERSETGMNVSKRLSPGEGPCVGVARFAIKDNKYGAYLQNYNNTAALDIRLPNITIGKYTFTFSNTPDPLTKDQERFVDCVGKESGPTHWNDLPIGNAFSEYNRCVNGSLDKLNFYVAYRDVDRRVYEARHEIVWEGGQTISVFFRGYEVCDYAASES